jgi:hypothetical protein
MVHRTPSARAIVLVAGDIGVYLLTTLLGFARHRELSAAPLNRIAATWIPFSAAWLAFAFLLGLLDPARLRDGPRLGRVLAAAVVAGAVGAALRGLWLGESLNSIFVVVMAAVTGGSLLLWRWLYGLGLRRAGADS